jgi:hypothetical protein
MSANKLSHADLIFDQEYHSALAKIATSNTRDQKQAYDTWVHLTEDRLVNGLNQAAINHPECVGLMNKLNLLECLSNLQSLEAMNYSLIAEEKPQNNINRTGCVARTYVMEDSLANVTEVFPKEKRC